MVDTSASDDMRGRNAAGKTHQSRLHLDAIAGQRRNQGVFVPFRRICDVPETL
jgi:hypothetical protein